MTATQIRHKIDFFFEPHSTMLSFILRMVKTRVTGIQFQVVFTNQFCHDDQMVHEANTALYIMDAGGGLFSTEPIGQGIHL